MPLYWKGLANGVRLGIFTHLVVILNAACQAELGEKNLRCLLVLPFQREMRRSREGFILDNDIDKMTEHPWTELQTLIKQKWLTQKAFALILWKKVSEVNELLKWKRNITIQRDYLLHQTLWTPIKYWILKQVDYDYSLLDIEDYKSPPLETVVSEVPSVRRGFRGGWGKAPKELGDFSLHVFNPSVILSF